MSFPTFILIQASPNVDRLIDNVIQGNTNEARIKMTRLLDDYPNDAGVLFLQAILELNGPESINIYKKIYKFHKNHKYTDDAIMKIAEYYYASGLYIQAAEWFKKIHMYHRRSDYLETSINMFLQCLIIAGSVDTAFSYSQTFSNIFHRVIC